MIVTYLIKALTEKESVFVTNLGLFTQQYQAAQIRDGQIIPPCHKVVFDPNYDGNGFAFTMFVSMKAGILTSDATVKVNQWVSELKNALDNNKSVSFENFGTFAKNSNGIITFESDRIAELNLEFEGMETVPLSHQTIGATVENQEEKEDDTPTTESEEASSTIAEIEKSDVEVVEEEKQTTLVESDEIVTTVEENGDENNNGNEEEEEKNDEDTSTKKPKKRRAWLVIVIIIVVLAILDTLGYIFREKIEAFYNQHIERGSAEEIEAQEPEDYSTETYEVIPSETDSVPEEAETDYTEASENETDKQANVTLGNASPTPSGNLADDGNFIIRFEKGKHYVIAGSFPTEADVRKHIKQQHLEKYNPKAVKQDGVSNLRVCIGIFDNEADAENFRDSVNPKYWVLN